MRLDDVAALPDVSAGWDALRLPKREPKMPLIAFAAQRCAGGADDGDAPGPCGGPSISRTHASLPARHDSDEVACT